MRAPLEDIEILDLGTPTPGKYCTFLLADLGADVLRIERPQRSPGSITTEDLVLNRGKRSMTLNLREGVGRDVFYRLTQRADVVIESNRPGVAQRIGMDYGRLSELNGRLVYCSLSGFGQDGPYRVRPAYDLTFMGLSGVLQALVGRGAAPFPPGIFLADAVAGLTSALAISVALLARERTGEGRYLDLAMLDSIFSILATSHGLLRTSGPSAGDETEAWFSPLYAIYQTSDDRYVTLAAIRPASGEALFRALGRPDLAERTRSREESTAEVKEFLENAFRTATAEEWVERLAELDVEIGLVRSPDEAFADPQLAFRHMVIDGAHAQVGKFRQIGNPLRASPNRPERLSEAASAVGSHTEEVLRELGFDEHRISRLRDTGAI